MARITFQTTIHGLRRNLPPLRLFEKARCFGVWNPSDIDLSQDMRDRSTAAMLRLITAPGLGRMTF